MAETGAALKTDASAWECQLVALVWLWPVAADATRKVRTKPLDPKPDSFPADKHARLCEQVFNIRCAHRKLMVRSHRIGDNFARKTKPLQTGKSGRKKDITDTLPPNNLAIPGQGVRKPCNSCR